ncbi:MAG: PAS domain-containing protein, partial [Burkholderiales bacterium]
MARQGLGLRWFWLFSALLVGGFYIVGLWIPGHIALPIYYAAALVLSVALPGRREKIAVAGAFTALLLADAYYMHSTPAMAGLASVENQAFALLMIWSVTTLGLRHQIVDADRRDNQRIANERLALLNTIYTSAPVGLCFVDLTLRYLSMNAALAAMNGQSAEYFLGKTIRQANPELADVIEVHYRRVIESGEAILDVEIKAPTQARPGERQAWLASYFP